MSDTAEAKHLFMQKLLPKALEAADKDFGGYSLPPFMCTSNTNFPIQYTRFTGRISRVLSFEQFRHYQQPQ